MELCAVLIASDASDGPAEEWVLARGKGGRNALFGPVACPRYPENNRVPRNKSEWKRRAGLIETAQRTRRARPTIIEIEGRGNEVGDEFDQRNAVRRREYIDNE